MHELRVCSETLADAARRLASNPAVTPEYPLGVARRDHGVVWLAGPPRPASRPPLPERERLRVFAEAEASRHPDERDRPGVCLLLGRGARAGYLTGVRVTPDGDGLPLDAISHVGPGMARLSIRPDDPSGELPGGLAADRVWARTIGALGPEAWSRLTDLRFAVAGCGRLGSVVTELLARGGVCRLTLMDADMLEPHNTGEMLGAGLADLGTPKVTAVAGFLGRRYPRTAVTPLAASLLALPALAAVKRCEVLISASDSPAARLAAGLLATAYLMPLLDLGTGIFHRGAGGPGRQMGADVRLILPGRCLLCFGGLRDLDRARQELLAPGDTARAPEVGLPGGRSGSLASLNAVAAGLAVRLLEDLALSRVEGSRWVRLEFDDAGSASLEQRAPPAVPGCPLCALTARGDAAISEATALMGAGGGAPG